MTILEALALCKSGHLVRPVCWRKLNPRCWIEFHSTGGPINFVECGVLQEIPHALRLEREEEFLGEWEVVE